MPRLPLNIIQCLYSMLQQLALLASPGECYLFLLLFSVAKVEMHNILSLPWVRQPSRRTQALGVLAAQRNNRRATCIMHFRTTGNSAALSTFFCLLPEMRRFSSR